MTANDRRVELDEIVGPGTRRPHSEEPTTIDILEKRSKRVAEDYPRALKLERDILDTVRPRLAGTREALRGTHDPDVWGDLLRGLRQSIPLYDICRLATSTRPEAGDAIDALIEALQRARGRGVAAPERTTILKAMRGIARAYGELSDEFLEAIEDGRLDAGELHRVRDAFQFLDRERLRLSTALARAFGQIDFNEGAAELGSSREPKTTGGQER